MSTKCDVVLIVRTPAAKLALLNGLTERGQLSVESEVTMEGSKMYCFRNRDKRKVGIIVSAATDARARLLKMCGVAAKTGCECLGLIDAGYDVEFMKQRRADVPSGCAVLFVDDLEMLMDLMGYDRIEAIQREVLKPLFAQEPAVVAPPPPPVPLSSRSSSVITAEDYGDPSDEDVLVRNGASSSSSSVQAGPGSVVMSNVSMDGATFRALMGLAAAQAPGSNPFQVVHMPANAEEELVLNESRRRRRANQSIMVDGGGGSSSGTGFQRVVPSAFTERLQQEFAASHRPLVPSRRTPLVPGSHVNLDLMDVGDDDDDDNEDREDNYEDLGEEVESIAIPEETPEVVSVQRPHWLEAFYAHNPAVSRPRDIPPGSRNLPQPPLLPIPPSPLPPPLSPTVSEAVRPMTNSERRRRQRHRANEQSQQRALGRIARNKETKKAVSKVREEAADISAMCTTAEDNTCTICMSSHITTMVLPCRHAHFCHGCITPWVNVHNNCPTCKTAVVTTVQMLTKFDPIEEHERRKRHPENLERDASAKARRKERADALRKEADELEMGRDE